MTKCAAFSMPGVWTMSAAPEEALASCPNNGRRSVLRLAVIAAAAAAVLPGTSTPVEALGVTSRQVINGVLSGYGLPTLADVQGLSPLLEQYDRLVVELQHPSDWIIARNVLASTMDSNAIAESTAKLSFGSSSKPMEGRASGLTVGDYRKAEGLAFFVSSNVPSGSKTADLPASVIINLVTPGDATSGVPECKVIKDGVDAASGYRKLLTKVSGSILLLRHFWCCKSLHLAPSNAS
jgi:hypothetical protein